jgi:hypothetical protein
VVAFATSAFSSTTDGAGVPLPPTVAGAPAAAALCEVPNTSANCSCVTHVSPKHSFSRAVSVSEMMLAIPFAVSANHWVRRAKKEVKKRPVKLDWFVAR